MGIIYCYTNNVKGKSYIGLTVNPRLRYNAHKSDAFNAKSRDYETPLHRAMRKYGYDNFTYSVLASSDSIEELNLLEIKYIKEYNTLIPNGYNILEGGRNCSRPLTEEQKQHIREVHRALSDEEIIYLREAYRDHKSPSAIYKEKYQGKMHYNAFLNIWCGLRYSNIMPEVFNDKGKRQTKLNEEIVRNIRIDREINHFTYPKLEAKYGVPKGNIAAICLYRTWKHVQIEPVSTISESGE